VISLGNAQGKLWETGPAGKKIPVRLINPHSLRRTFASAGDEADVKEYYISVLMNHRLPKDTMTRKYKSPDAASLRAAADKIAAYLLLRKRCNRVSGQPLLVSAAA